MATIKYKDRKLGRYRKGVHPFPNYQVKQPKAKRDANGKYEIESKYNGKCAICGHRYYEGSVVMFDPDKPVGRKVAHTYCYQEQRKVKND